MGLLLLLVVLIFAGEKFLSGYLSKTGEFVAERANKPTGDPKSGSLAQSQTKATTYRVAVINRSSVLTDADLTSAVTALQTQVHRDFAPI